jgi:hypothetical protein
VTSSCGIGSEGLFATSGPICTLSEKQASVRKARGLYRFPRNTNQNQHHEPRRVTERKEGGEQTAALLLHQDGRWGQPPRHHQPSASHVEETLHGRIAVKRLCVVSFVAGLHSGVAEIIILLINMWNH